MQENGLIVKECLRSARIDFEADLSDQNDAARVSVTCQREPEFARLSQEKLHNKLVAFIEQGENFFCYYTDFVNRLQRIKVPVSEFERQNKLFKMRADVSSRLSSLKNETEADSLMTLEREWNEATKELSEKQADIVKWQQEIETKQADILDLN